LHGTIFIVIALQLASLAVDNPEEFLQAAQVADAPLAGIVVQLRNRAQDAVLTTEERRKLQDLKSQETVNAFLSLGRVITDVAMTEARKVALQSILELEGWQDAAESVLLSSKLGWDEANAGTRHGPNSGNRWNRRTYIAIEVLNELADRGQSDAVLITAPFLFDRSKELPGDPPELPLSYSAKWVLISGRSDASTWNELPLEEWSEERERQRLRQWWVAHARDFGAQPPSSENATFEEVRELNLAARVRPGDHRFEPVPPPPVRPDEPRLPGAWNWDPASRTWQKTGSSAPGAGGSTAAPWKSYSVLVGSGITILALTWGFIMWRRFRSRTA
jgi:hypothetical protein